MDWAAEADVELGLRLAVALENFWVTHDPAEGARRFEALLARGPEVDRTLAAQAWRDYGACADTSGDYDLARTALTMSGDLYREAGDESGVATANFRLGVVATRTGDVEQGRQLWEQSLQTWHRLGDSVGELQALGNLGWFEFEHGDFERGWDLTERSLELAQEVGWTWWIVGRMGELAERALEAGRTDEGDRRAREFLALAHRIEDRTDTVYGLGIAAWAAAKRGDPERAAILWTAIEAEEARGPLPMWAPSRDKFAAHMPAEVGSVPTLSLPEAVAYALGEDT
jgi:tetratricopeptide (TPR) repeat protein